MKETKRTKAVHAMLSTTRDAKRKRKRKKGKKKRRRKKENKRKDNQEHAGSSRNKGRNLTVFAAACPYRVLPTGCMLASSLDLEI